MPIYAKTLYDYIKSNGYGKAYIVDDRIKDKEFRKKLIREYFLKIINAIEYCVADKTRILSDTTKNIYKEREYHTCCFYYDGKGGLESRDEAIWVKEGDDIFQDGGILGDTRLTEYIYYNSTIPHIYHLKHLEYIKGNREEMPLSLIELTYPAKMPKKDYFPFAEFDIGTKIPLLLTAEEKQRYEENYDIKDFDWNYCIFWIDKDRMFMSLDCNNYYFKQIGKNVHLFDLTFQCV